MMNQLNMMNQVNMMNQLNIERVDRIEDVFAMAEILGTGTFGSVYRVKPITAMRTAIVPVIPLARKKDCSFSCRWRKTVRKLMGCKKRPAYEAATMTEDPVMIKEVEDFALKVILPNPNFKKSWMETECVAHSMVSGHPHVVHLHNIFIEDRGEGYCLQLQLAAGGDLLAHVKSREDTLSEMAGREKIVKKMCKQVASAIRHAHQRKIIHRDIKLENIFFTDQSLSHALLGDWGLAAVMKEGSEARSDPCGSVHYAAPELFLDDQYSYAVDMWALGICVYAVLTGAFPFFGNSHTEICNMIVMGEYQPIYHTLSVSQACIEVVAGLLEVDPEERLTADELLDHDWILQD